MYKRLIIVSVVILLALGGLTWMGLYSINLQAEGLENKRYAEFRDVAEQIRVRKKGSNEDILIKGKEYDHYKDLLKKASAWFVRGKDDYVSIEIGGEIIKGRNYDAFIQYGLREDFAFVKCDKCTMRAKCGVCIVELEKDWYVRYEWYPPLGEATSFDELCQE